ncbi:membrane-anchored junction protein isoform X3 [Alexandromys fortis]|uniref:membrane-anchored junction protein isoform X3 n=1 Tax=Alexandromys fortis TaxID=100897 RepID=UPI002152B66F|nr:membrane-anchored junction protein isoform X3 [Microtus fortis]
MSLKPFTYPFPETRFLHAGPNVYKFKIRYGDSIREEEIEDKEVVIQELEDSIRAVLANMDSLQPFVTEHFTVFPYKSKWERVSHLKFKHGDIILTPYPFVFTLYVEMKWFTGNMPTGKPTDDSPLELVLAEKKAEETTMRKRKLVDEPNSPSRPRPYRAKIETSSEAFSNQKPLKKNQRVVMVHAFNPSTQETDRRISVSLSLTWSSEQVREQAPKLQRNPVSRGKKKNYSFMLS